MMTHDDYINIIHSKKRLARHSQGPSAADLENLKNQALKSANEMDSILAGLVGAAEQRGLAFKDALTKSIGNTLIDVSKQFTFLEERNRSLNESLGITTVNSAELGQQLDTFSKRLSIGGDTARKFAVSLNSVASGLITAKTMQTDFGESMLAAQSYMRNQINVSEQAAQGYELYAAGLGRSSTEQLLAQDALAGKIEKATDLQGVQRDLTETIGSLTADLQMQYGRIPGSLELAVLKSRALGMSMAELNKTGQNLLNIESSIGQELEYQLLTGNRLVDEVSGESLTNAYREATLRGDANKQAEVMNRLLEQEGGTLENNLLARQQMAKLLGTDEATIARSLQKKKLLKQLDAESIMELSAEDAKSEIEKLRQKYAGDTEKQKQIDDLLKATDTRTSADRTADAVEKMATAMLGDNQVKTITDTAKAFTEAIADKTIQSGLKDLLNSPAMTAVANTIGTYATISTSLSNILQEFKTLFKQGRIDVKGTERGGIRQPAVADAKVNDAIIQFNPQDKFMQVGSNTMLASTERGQLNTAAQTLTGTGNSSISSNDMQMMANMIAAAVSKIKLNANIEMPLGAASELNNGRFA